MSRRSHTPTLAITAALILSGAGDSYAKPIQHDAEHYVLRHQYAEQWAAEDEEIR